MKTNKRTIFFLLIVPLCIVSLCNFVFSAETFSPSPNLPTTIRGNKIYTDNQTYEENVTVEGITTLEGPINLDGNVSGAGIRAYIGAGKESITNLVPFNTVFSDPTYWYQGATDTPVQMSGFQRIIQNVVGTTFMLQWINVADTEDKNIIFTAKVMAVGNINLNIKFAGTGGVDFVDYLDNNHWTIIRGYVKPASTDVRWSISNTDSVSPFGLDVEYWEEHPEIQKAMYANGDSHGVNSFLQSASTSFPSGGSVYINQVAMAYNIDYLNNSFGGDSLAQIAPKVIADLLNKKYDMILLAGGTNSIADGDNATAMLASTTSMVDAAKLSSNNIGLSTSPSCPDFDAGEIIINDTYNASIRVKYENDSFVNIIDLDEILVVSDFLELDGIHITDVGHTKWADAIKSAMPLPYTAATFKTPTTGASSVWETNGSKLTERILTDWTKIRTITDNDTIQSNNIDVDILLDATSNAVTARPLASPTKGEIHTFKSINADNTCTVNGNGKNIDGSASFTLALKKFKQIKYDGTEWWILSEN